MRLSIVFYLFLLSCQNLRAQQIPIFSLPMIEGGTQSLANYGGKKLLFITLPLQQTTSSDSLFYSLDTLAAAHAATLKIIGVPSIEDGYTSAQRETLQEWYRSKLGAGILITEGLYTHKSSGSQQHTLFKWLTNEEQNEVLNIDAPGPGYKFFCDADGKLYGVLLPQSKLHGASVQKLLHLQ